MGFPIAVDGSKTSAGHALRATLQSVVKVNNKSVVLVGDPDDRNCRVVSGSPVMSINSIPVARVTSQVSPNEEEMDRVVAEGESVMNVE